MRITLFILLLFFGFNLLAQLSPVNIGNGLLVNMSFGGQTPAGDLASRFGLNLNVGGGVDFLTRERNFIFGIEGSYIFGTDVRQDVIASLKTADGFIIANDRAYADIQLRQRGFYVGAIVGKLFSLSATNPRSGIRATFGLGLLQHKIRIQDDPFRGVPQLDEAYKKGYDRLSNGLTLSQFIGYQLLSADKRQNFYAGFDFVQGFTKNRRDFNFDTRTQDTEQRIDLLFGFRVGWVLPFYLGKGSDEIYY